jgi:hypothetical protein
VSQDIGKVSLPEVKDIVTILVLDSRPAGRDNAGREGFGKAQRVTATVNENLLCSAGQRRRCWCMLGVFSSKPVKQLGVIARSHAHF